MSLIAGRQPSPSFGTLSIAQGTCAQSGQIAVVLDASAFDSKTGPGRLVLELFRRGDGLRQAWVHLDKKLLFK
jgi:hypothetical protein